MREDTMRRKTLREVLEAEHRCEVVISGSIKSGCEAGVRAEIKRIIPQVRRMLEANSGRVR